MSDAQLREWIERERARGALASAAIVRERRVQQGATGLERFATRMAMVELTGSIARWAGAVRDGLAKAGCTEAAALFALTPPFAEPEPTQEDYDRLDDYVQARVAMLTELLAARGP